MKSRCLSRRKSTPPFRSSAAAVLVALLCLAAPVRAQSSDKPAAIEVRLALSEPASVLLVPPRFRRYLSIELDDAGDVDPDSGGPLHDRVAYVWIDLPSPGQVRIQTRMGRHPIATRTFSLREGLRADVAARLVAIATSEMVRAQARPSRTRKPKRPKPPTSEQIELATRDNPAVLFAGGASGAWLPSAGALLGGSELDLSYRLGGVRQHLLASWLGGSSDGGPMQWMDVGLGLDHGWWTSAHWRIAFGATARAGLVRMRDVVSVDGEQGERETWSSRASGRLQVQRLLSGPTWLGLSLEPGVILRSSSYLTNAGDEGELKGFFLGLGLSLELEQRYGSEPVVTVSRGRKTRTTR